MIASLAPSPDITPVTLDTAHLPALRFHDWNSRSSQIAAYIRRLLGKYQTAEQQVHLTIPSVLTLADWLQCCEMDIIDALHELKTEQYAYLLTGIDEVIQLRDPLSRAISLDKPARRWHMFTRILKRSTHMAPRQSLWQQPVWPALLGKPSTVTL
jgi:hypothetical protein